MSQLLATRRFPYLGGTLLAEALALALVAYRNVFLLQLAADDTDTVAVMRHIFQAPIVLRLGTRNPSRRSETQHLHVVRARGMG